LNFSGIQHIVEILRRGPKERKRGDRDIGRKKKKRKKKKASAVRAVELLHLPSTTFKGVSGAVRKEEGRVDIAQPEKRN